MKQYSDYYRAVDGYLKNFNKFKVAIENLESERQAKLFQLSGYSTPIARYGEGSYGGGSDNLTQPEAMTAKRLKLAEEAESIMKDIAEIQRIIDKVDKALEGLDHDHRQAVVLSYFERLDWWKIADEMHYSAKWCRNLRDQALQDMALMIFGIKACPGELKFCFMS